MTISLVLLVFVGGIVLGYRLKAVALEEAAKRQERFKKAVLKEVEIQRQRGGLK